ncbi:hypothetical protein ES319_D08G025600v1 [Gossypium barbadense]|uniref:Defensin-like protein n=5 Tax=Gossypium TaxID=3633 RepID=A0A5J5Q8K9_GOSBA|nr:hypothetical protein ES319_D08G025600v1 [Gossypium barbadense]TYH56544.1 hypothetical protein ES332_D08G026500v1 [Gossypium tomentosum]
MITLFKVFFILALLVFTSAKVNGAQCEEEMGICDENCSSRCEASKNGKGICVKSSLNGIRTCKCLYECSGNGNNNDNDDNTEEHENQECNMGIGRCGVFCNDDCCNHNCVKRFKDGYGTCIGDIGTPSAYNCVCYYHCH